MDRNLDRVLKKQEYEYMQAYNINVKKKETELREYVEHLNKESKEGSQKLAEI